MSNNQMVSEILPCPYCGQQDFLIERLDSDASVVICQGLTGPHESCLARGPVGVAQDDGEEQPGRDKAIELWNARAEQHGEPVACSHEWTDDGEFMLVCTVCGAQENHDPKWRDMATAPRDGTLVRLLVEFTEHATEDSEAMPSPTIGANSFDHTGEDLWQFAGWSWEQDCFTQGTGEPVGWLPLLDTPHADPAEVERLRAEIKHLQHTSVKEEVFEIVCKERDTLRDQLAAKDSFIHDLETNCDPAGMVRENTLFRDQLTQCNAMIGRLKRELADSEQELRKVRGERDEIEGRSVDIQTSLNSKLVERDALLQQAWKETDCSHLPEEWHKRIVELTLSASAEPSAPVGIDHDALVAAVCVLRSQGLRNLSEAVEIARAAMERKP